MEAMKSDVDEIALQGIEFWSTVCDEEINLAIASSEAEEAGQPTQSTAFSRHYAKGALQFLVPILMQKLTQQVRFLLQISGHIRHSFNQLHLRCRKNLTMTMNGSRAKQPVFVCHCWSPVAPKMFCLMFYLSSKITLNIRTGDIEMLRCWLLVRIFHRVKVSLWATISHFSTCRSRVKKS